MRDKYDLDEIMKSIKIDTETVDCYDQGIQKKVDVPCYFSLKESQTITQAWFGNDYDSEYTTFMLEFDKVEECEQFYLYADDHNDGKSGRVCVTGMVPEQIEDAVKDIYYEKFGGYEIEI